MGTTDGRGVYAAWLTPQGRMITDLRLLRDSERVVAEVPEGLAPALATRFDQLIFAEKVSVFDDSPQTRQLVVFGNQAGRVVDDLVSTIGNAQPGIATLPVLGHFSSGEIRVVRTDDVALPNYSIWMPAERWDSVVATLHNKGAVNDRGTAALFDALRVEDARPRFGVDLTTETIPLEAGLLDRAISMTKGCYVGQEVIVRILHRGGGRVVKQLVKLEAEPGVTAVPEAGTVVLDGEKETGKVTSAAIGPAAGRVVALAYVHRESAEVGRRLTLASGQEVSVAALAA